ncbi:MAG: hypothetical protein ABFD79_06155 [Phycisphaerales bacterium]
MAKRINFVTILLITLFTENIFAFDNFWDWHSQRFFHRPRFGPVPMIQPPIAEMIEPQIVTILITNNNGSQTEIKLTPTADGFIGPKGEFYSAMPTQDQLKPLYGLYSPPPVRNNLIYYLGKVNGIEKIVVLTKEGSEYIGPRGEKYFNLPTAEELKIIYVTTANSGT